MKEILCHNLYFADDEIMAQVIYILGMHSHNNRARLDQGILTPETAIKT